MEAENFYRTSVTIYQTAQVHIQEYSNLHICINCEQNKFTLVFLSSHLQSKNLKIKTQSDILLFFFMTLPRL
jgi:hypothetical protein